MRSKFFINKLFFEKMNYHHLYFSVYKKYLKNYYKADLLCLFNTFLTIYLKLFKLNYFFKNKFKFFFFKLIYTKIKKKIFHWNKINSRLIILKNNYFFKNTLIFKKRKFFRRFKKNKFNKKICKFLIIKSPYDELSTKKKLFLAKKRFFDNGNKPEKKIVINWKKVIKKNKNFLYPFFDSLKRYFYFTTELEHIKKKKIKKKKSKISKKELKKKKLKRIRRRNKSKFKKWKKLKSTNRFLRSYYYKIKNNSLKNMVGLSTLILYKSKLKKKSNKMRSRRRYNNKFKNKKIIISCKFVSNKRRKYLYSTNNAIKKKKCNKKLKNWILKIGNKKTNKLFFILKNNIKIKKKKLFLIKNKYLKFKRFIRLINWGCIKKKRSNKILKNWKSTIKNKIIFLKKNNFIFNFKIKSMNFFLLKSLNLFKKKKIHKIKSRKKYFWKFRRWKKISTLKKNKKFYYIILKIKKYGYNNNALFKKAKYLKSFFVKIKKKLFFINLIIKTGRIVTPSLLTNKKNKNYLKFFSFLLDDKLIQQNFLPSNLQHFFNSLLDFKFFFKAYLSLSKNKIKINYFFHKIIKIFLSSIKMFKTRWYLRKFLNKYNSIREKRFKSFKYTITKKLRITNFIINKFYKKIKNKSKNYCFNFLFKILRSKHKTRKLKKKIEKLKMVQKTLKKMIKKKLYLTKKQKIGIKKKKIWRPRKMWKRYKKNVKKDSLKILKYALIKKSKKNNKKSKKLINKLSKNFFIRAKYYKMRKYLLKKKLKNNLNFLLKKIWIYNQFNGISGELNLNKTMIKQFFLISENLAPTTSSDLIRKNYNIKFNKVFFRRNIYAHANITNKENIRVKKQWDFFNNFKNKKYSINFFDHAFKLFHLFIKKLFLSTIRHGKKGKANYFLTFCIKQLKRKYKLSFFNFMFVIFKTVDSAYTAKNLSNPRKGARLGQDFRDHTCRLDRRRLKYPISWILQSAKMRVESSFELRLFNELINIYFKKKCETFKKIKEFNKHILFDRSKRRNWRIFRKKKNKWKKKNVKKW